MCCLEKIPHAVVSNIHLRFFIQAGILFAVLHEHGKGLGLFTCQPLCYHQSLGPYRGVITRRPLGRDGTVDERRGFVDVRDKHDRYVLELKHVWIDGDPDLDPMELRGVKIGSRGRAGLAFANEAGPGERTNVSWRIAGDSAYIVVAVREGIPAWHPILVCYGERRLHGSRPYAHTCQHNRCAMAWRNVQKLPLSQL